MLDYIIEIIERYSPYIVGGAIGAVIHRLRTQMSLKDFIASIAISIFVSVSVGIVCKDYFAVEQQNVIFVLCGISGTFSKVILDEIQEIISSFSDIFKRKMGVTEDVPNVEEETEQ